MKIGFLSFLSAAGLSLCLGLPVMAQTSSPISESVDSATPSSSEIIKEDTSVEDSNKPAEMGEKPMSPEGTQSTSESDAEAGTMVEELTNTTEEVEKTGSGVVETEVNTVESETEEQVSPTTQTPDSSVPTNIQK